MKLHHQYLFNVKLLVNILYIGIYVTETILSFLPYMLLRTGVWKEPKSLKQKIRHYLEDSKIYHRSVFCVRKKLQYK